MPLQIERSPAARGDLARIFGHVARDNETAAEALLDRFETVLGLLALNPASGRLRPDLGPDLRSFPVGRYVIFYTPRADILLVVRVLHGHQDISAKYFSGKGMA